LELDSNYAGPEGARAFALNKTLTTLNFNKNNVGNEGAQALARNDTLKDLSLENNNVGDAGAEAFAENKTLQKLNLYSNNIGHAGAKALAGNTTLTTLILDFNNVGDTGAQALAKNTTLKTLLLGYNKIGNAGAEALAKNTTLAYLNLDGNTIGDTGAKALAGNTTLAYLNLDDNIVGDVGAEALAKNTTLEKLYLSLNEIGNVGAKALAKNTTLLWLWINDSKKIISDTVLNQLLTQISNNRRRYEQALQTLEKRGTYRRKDIPEPEESTEWMEICRELGNRRMDELKKIARQVGIKPNGKTKRKLCVELARHFESLQPTEPHKSGCYNEYDILGDPFDEMNPRLYQSYEFQTHDGKQKYCFSLADLAGLAPDFKDPFTRKRLPQHIIDWYHAHRDLYQVHELKPTKRGTRREQAIYIADILDKQERRLGGGRFQFIPDTTKYFQVAPLLADKPVIDEYRRVIRNQELIQDLGFQQKFKVGDPIDDYDASLLDTLKWTRENRFDDLETLKWLYIEVMNKTYYG